MIKKPTNIEDIKNSSVSVYRNNDNQIVVNFGNLSDLEGIISIYNLYGQKLLSTPSTGANTVIDAKLKAGVYVVSVLCDKSPMNFKVMLH